MAAVTTMPGQHTIAKTRPRHASKAPVISCLLVDIGGVLLTDGWNHEDRAMASKKFALNADEMEIRHRQAFETYEADALSLDRYLDLVIFYRPQSFSRKRFTAFMFAQSQPIPAMIALVRALKEKYRLKVVVISNEARALNAHRIKKFALDTFVDSFVSSCFVHLRKPDPEIFRMALDIAQVPAHQVVYLEDTPMFVDIADEMGIHGILHTDVATTSAALATFGLMVEKP